MTGGSVNKKIKSPDNQQYWYQILTKYAHVPIVFNEHSRHIRVFRMAGKSFAIIFDRRHKVQYRNALIFFGVITYAFERFFALQPSYDCIRSRPIRLTIKFIFPISNKNKRTIEYFYMNWFHWRKVLVS